MPRRMRTTVAALAALALCAASAASGTAPAPIAASAADPPQPAAAGAGLGLSPLGLQGWTVQSSRVVTQSGDQVSRPGFPTGDWLRVRPDDAGAPGTEMEAMLQNGICPHDPSFQVDQSLPMTDHSVFFSNNMRRCFGLMDTVGPDTIPEFSVPWWFRTDF